VKEYNAQMMEIKSFCDEVNAWITTAPSAEDLDSCDEYLRQLSAYYSRYTVISGMNESIYSQLLMMCIRDMPDEEYKRVKHSSTLTDFYIKGKYPKATAIFEQCRSVKHLLVITSDNYRTLLSSFRQERILVGHMTT
jgi:polysaccharide pyruvyl transferase WcaK-like protein